jgi:hypothetical protein
MVAAFMLLQVHGWDIHAVSCGYELVPGWQVGLLRPVRRLAAPASRTAPRSNDRGAALERQEGGIHTA